jgi:hypothetical protein
MQAEAARLRGILRSSINELVQKGRFKIHMISGRPLLSKTEVLNFELNPGDRPPKVNGKKSARR